MDKWLAMKVFTRVVEAGGFTRAADSLSMPKASVSTLVQDLEGQLGVKLLNRTTRQVSVTADGAAYYERCVRLLNELEEVETSLSQARSTPKGRLRVDVPGTLGRLTIIPHLHEFQRRYPDIQLELGVSDRPVDLLEEGVDCVVRGGKLEDSSLIARHLGMMQFVTCATPAYLARHGEPRTPEDLQKHRCLNYFSPKTGKMFPWDFTQAGERIEVPLPGSFATNDADAYLRAGLAGLGVFQTATCMAIEHVQAGQLRVIMRDWPTEPLPLNVLYPQNRHLSAKVRVWVDWIVELTRESGIFTPTREDLFALQESQLAAA